jgi:hypothetical protein
MCLLKMIVIMKDYKGKSCVFVCVCLRSQVPDTRRARSYYIPNVLSDIYQNHFEAEREEGNATGITIK